MAELKEIRTINPPPPPPLEKRYVFEFTEKEVRLIRALVGGVSSVGEMHRVNAHLHQLLASVDNRRFARDFFPNFFEGLRILAKQGAKL